MEAKIDAILLAVEPKNGDSLLKDIDAEYEGRHTDSGFVRKLEREYSESGPAGKAHDFQWQSQSAGYAQAIRRVHPISIATFPKCAPLSMCAKASLA
jgi:hypothetical protein